MSATVRRRVRFVWNTARFFTRMLLEYAATVWLLGIAPFLAQLAAARPDRGYAWIPNDLYLFVMVIAGNVTIAAFKDREADGPTRPFAAIIGVAFALFGAWAFGRLEAGTAPGETLVRSLAYRTAPIIVGIDLAYRARRMLKDAMIEAHRKESISSCTM